MSSYQVLAIESSLDQAELRTILDQAVVDLLKLYPEVGPQSYYFRVVYKDGLPQRAFVKMSTEFYRVLMGLNLDGTDRLVYSDCDWEKLSWRNRYLQQQKQLIQRLPPLIKLGGPSDRLFIRDARLPELKASYMSNIIRTRDCPFFLKEEIKKHYEKFASDPKTLVGRPFNGTVISDTFPFVTINTAQEVFITFDHRTQDAQWALLLAPRFYFQTKEGESKVLTFTHSFKTKRDMAIAKTLRY